MNRTIDEALKQLAEKQRQDTDGPGRLEAEARKLGKEIDRFIRLIAGGTAPVSVLAEIKRREARIAEIERELQRLKIEALSEADLRHLKAEFRERLGRFDELLRSDVPLARQALRKLIAGRIEFHPVERDGERGYRLRWAIATRAVMEGNIGMASPRRIAAKPAIRFVRKIYLKGFRRRIIGPPVVVN